MSISFSTSSSILYSLSNLFQKIGFHGILWILLVYVDSPSIGFTDSLSISTYRTIAPLLVITQLLGGVLGDLILGYKRAMLIGLITQSLGAFILTIPSVPAVCLGMGALFIGNGLYSPNVLAAFGNLLQKENKKLSAGFTLFFAIISIGVLLGSILFPTFKENGNWNWNYAFILAGILLAISALPILLSDKTPIRKETTPHKTSPLKITSFVLMLICYGVFWFTLEVTASLGYSVQEELFDYSYAHPLSVLYGIAFLIPISISLFFFWKHKKEPSFRSLIIGSVISILGYLIFSLIPSSIEPNIFILFLLFSFVSVTAQLLLPPLTYSFATRLTNPKFLGLTMASISIPKELITWIAMPLTSNISGENSDLALLSAALMGVVTLVFIVLFFLNKREEKKTKEKRNEPEINRHLVDK